MAMSTEIYIAHKRETSNGLYALARSEHKRFHVSECISANSRIVQVVRQSIPHRWTNHRESPSGSGAYLATCRSRRLADRCFCHDATLEVRWQKSIRYCGAWPCIQLYIMTLSLYTTRSGTSSQCSSVCKSRDKPRSNLFVPLTIRAATFNTR